MITYEIYRNVHLENELVHCLDNLEDTNNMWDTLTCFDFNVYTAYEVDEEKGSMKCLWTT